MLQHFHGHIDVGVAAQGGGQARNVRRPVTGIGHDDHVGVEFITMILDERDEARRAHLLLAFDEDLDVHAKIVAQRLQRAGVNGNATAVVRGATAVQPAVDLGADERIGVPHAGIRHRLHVMMRVQQHGGRVRVDDPGADDFPCAGGAVRIMRLRDLGVHAHLAHLFGHEFGGTLHMIRCYAMSGNGLQCDLTVEHIDDALPVLFDASADNARFQLCHVQYLFSMPPVCRPSDDADHGIRRCEFDMQSYIPHAPTQKHVIPRHARKPATLAFPSIRTGAASRRHRNLQA